MRYGWIRSLRTPCKYTQESIRRHTHLSPGATRSSWRAPPDSLDNHTRHSAVTFIMSHRHRLARSSIILAALSVNYALGKTSTPPRRRANLKPHVIPRDPAEMILEDCLISRLFSQTRYRTVNPRPWPWCDVWWKYGKWHLRLWDAPKTFFLCSNKHNKITNTERQNF